MFSGAAGDFLGVSEWSNHSKSQIFACGAVFQNQILERGILSFCRVHDHGLVPKVISSHLTWGVTWIREFGFRFCPEEAKKHWRFEKGSLRTALWFDKHFRFWNQITGRFDLSHYNDREIMIGLSMTVGFMILWNRRHVQRRTILFTSRSEQHSSSLICGDKITDTDGTREVAPDIWCELIFHDYANLCIRF